MLGYKVQKNMKTTQYSHQAHIIMCILLTVIIVISA